MGSMNFPHCHPSGYDTLVEQPLDLLEQNDVFYVLVSNGLLGFECYLLVNKR